MAFIEIPAEYCCHNSVSQKDFEFVYPFATIRAKMSAELQETSMFLKFNE
jgi:hypothetical protein